MRGRASVTATAGSKRKVGSGLVFFSQLNVEDCSGLFYFVWVSIGLVLECLAMPVRRRLL